MTTEWAGKVLRAVEARPPDELLEAVREVLHQEIDAVDVRILLADYDLLLLRSYEGGSIPSDAQHALSRAGEPMAMSFNDQETVVVPTGDGWSVYVPISTRGERVGVLEVQRDEPLGSDVIQEIANVAVLLAYLAPRAALYADRIERARRTQPLTLPAEIQWSELSVRAYAGPGVVVAGQLCPAYEVGGDIFDFTIDGDHLTVTSLDAMGHGLNASLLGSLAINSLRNSRRAGLALVDQVRAADRVLYGQHGGEQFVCGAFLRLNITTGLVSGVNAGHPVGALLRGGVAVPIALPAQLPMGLFERTNYEANELQLEPGDRVVVVSDGVLEASPPGGEEYGEERLHGALLATSAMPPNEVVRTMIRVLLEYEGVDLRDDITVVILDWPGPADR